MVNFIAPKPRKEKDELTSQEKINVLLVNIESNAKKLVKNKTLSSAGFLLDSVQKALDFKEIGDSYKVYFEQWISDADQLLLLSVKKILNARDFSESALIRFAERHKIGEIKTCIKREEDTEGGINTYEDIDYDNSQCSTDAVIDAISNGAHKAFLPWNLLLVLEAKDEYWLDDFVEHTEKMFSADNG